MWLFNQLNYIRVWEIVNGNDDITPRERLMRLRLENPVQPNTSTAEELEAEKLANAIDCVIVTCRMKTAPKLREKIRLLAISQVHLIADWHSRSSQNMQSLATGSALDKTLEIASATAVPDWSYFHRIYIGLDACKLTLAAVDLITSENRQYRTIDPSELEMLVMKIRGDVLQYASSAHQAAAKMKIRLQADFFVEDLVKGAIGQAERSNCEVSGTVPVAEQLTRDMRHLLPEPFVQQLSVKLRRGWIEALEGILKVKIS